MRTQFANLNTVLALAKNLNRSSAESASELAGAYSLLTTNQKQALLTTKQWTAEHQKAIAAGSSGISVLQYEKLVKAGLISQNGVLLAQDKDKFANAAKDLGLTKKQIDAIYKLAAAKRVESASVQNAAGAWKAYLAANWVSIAIGAATVIWGIVNAVKAHREELERLKSARQQDAASAAQEYKSEADNLKSIADETTELRDKLNDSNTSYSEAHDARARLYEIQQGLIDKYGAEAGAINLVNGELKEQIALLGQSWLSRLSR